MKERNGINFNINLSNRVAYTLMAILILAIVGVGVYALTPGGNPSGTPSQNPGHLISIIDPPSPCTNNQVLQWDNTDGVWKCATMTTTESDPTVKVFAKNGITSCASGSSIRVVNADGTVTCQTDNAGTTEGLWRSISLNIGEDTYTNAGTAYTGDTCNGDNNNFYSCPVNADQTCVDVNAGNSRKNVVCKNQQAWVRY